MGMMSRMLRLFKADLHGVMDQLEDRELLIKQYLREMEAGLTEKENHYAEMIRDARQVARETEQREKEMTQLSQDIDLAVAKDKDDIARMLIRKRRSLETTVSQLKGQAAALAEERQQLETTINRQRLEYEEYRTRSAVCLRKAAAITRDSAMPGVGEGNDFLFPSDEEIELELLQRKEAAARGGAA